MKPRRQPPLFWLLLALDLILKQGLGKDKRVKRLATGNALLELRRLAFQLVIGQGFQAVFKGVDLVDLAAILFEQPVVAAAENRF